MQTIEPRPSGASKKIDERSEFQVAFDLAFAFSKIHENINQKIAPRIERNEIQ